MLIRFRSRGRGVAAIVLFAVAGSGACTSFVPAGAGVTPAPGTRVRLDFGTPREVGMGAVTANGVRTLTGELVGADSATLTVAALSAVSDGGYETLGPGLSVVIPRQAVREVRINRISSARSAGFAASVLGLALIVVGGLASSGGGGGGGGPNGGGGSTN